MSRPKMFKLTEEVTDTMRAMGIKRVDMIERLEQSVLFKSPTGEPWNRRFENWLFRVGDDGTVFEIFKGPRVGDPPEKGAAQKADTDLLLRALTLLEGLSDEVEHWSDEDATEFEILVDDLSLRLTKPKGN